jgi:hypothetical protein
LEQPTKAQRAESDEQLSPPKVIIPLKNIRINEGQPATLLTKITGHPFPKVKE